MFFSSIALSLLLINFTSARLHSPDAEHINSKINEKHRNAQECNDLGLRFSKVEFLPGKENFANQVTLPLQSEDFPIPIDGSNNDLLDLLKESLCPSVTRLDDFEIFFDVREMIEGDFVGGYPVHAGSSPNCPFWGYMREVVEIQALRRVNNGSDPAIDVMPLPIIWNDYTLDMVAEAVHDEYPNYHQARNLARMIDEGQGVVYDIDNNIIPQRATSQFLRGAVMIADMNTWATTVVGPHSFSAKFAVGRARPEETAWSIKTGAISRQNVPSDIYDMIAAIPDFNTAVDFTAYDEGSPRHPSWPAMHSAASQTSFWMDIVLDLTPEELCQARLTDYGVAYARTVAGVHYPDDNIDGLNLGQEVIAMALPAYLSWKYDADEQSVRDKIESKRYDWNTFDPQNPCPFVPENANNGWTRITSSGGVTGISVYESYIYGVGFDNNVYKHRVDGSGTWSRVNNSGGVTSIAVYDSYVYGVGFDNNVYKHKVDGSGSWSRVNNSGGVTSIDVYDSYVYGVGFDNNVYKHKVDGSGSWSRVNNGGGVKRIDVYEGFIYGVGFDEDVWRHRVNGFGSWTKVNDTGSVKAISVYEGNVYGVGLDHKVYRHEV